MRDFPESVDFIRQLLKVGDIERNPLSLNGLSHHHSDGTLSA